MGGSSEIPGSGGGSEPTVKAGLEASVLKVLTAQGSPVDPKRFPACGRGKYLQIKTLQFFQCGKQPDCHLERHVLAWKRGLEQVSDQRLRVVGEYRKEQQQDPHGLVPARDPRPCRFVVLVCSLHPPPRVNPTRSKTFLQNARCFLEARISAFLAPLRYPCFA